MTPEAIAQRARFKQYLTLFLSGFLYRHDLYVSHTAREFTDKYRTTVGVSFIADIPPVPLHDRL